METENKNMHLRDVVQQKDGFVLVDTQYVRLDGEYETMVFKCNSDGSKVDYAKELRSDVYETEEDARDGHEFVVNVMKNN